MPKDHIEPTPYTTFAKFYDACMGERDEIPTVKRLIKKFTPQAKSVLELGCGTGTVLKALAKNYKVCGLDTSVDMLALAASELKVGTPLYHTSMTSFNLRTTYDVAICVFNSINHLHSLSQWSACFRRASKHINPDGLFLFDAITEVGLEAYRSEPVRIVEDVDIFGRPFFGTMMFRADRGKRTAIDVETFEEVENGLYRRSRTTVIEAAFPTKQIKTELNKYFKSVQIIDPERSRHSAKSEMLYFACQGPL
jgi:SAM-dependent methyltransferase